MTTKESIKFTLESLRKFGSSDWEDTFKNDLGGLDQENDKAADIFLIENAAEFDSYDMFIGATDDDGWRWHYIDIVTGDYPLEKLPTHVRDIARRLYYDKEPAQKSA